MVNRIEDQAPSSKAGLKRGDVIIKFNRDDISSYENLQEKVVKASIGEKISLTILRDGMIRKVQIQIEKLDPEYFIEKISEGNDQLI